MGGACIGLERVSTIWRQARGRITSPERTLSKSLTCYCAIEPYDVRFSAMPLQSPQLVLVTGATGYVGGRLVPRLVEAGHRVRCLVRDPSRLQGRPWRRQVEVVQGDVLDPDSLHEPMRDINVLYYLIHSLGEGSGFEQLDVQAAQNCSAAAKASGVERLIFVGGLGDARTQLSPHLRSRHHTGDALRECR